MILEFGGFRLTFNSKLCKKDFVTENEIHDNNKTNIAHCQSERNGSNCDDNFLFTFVNYPSILLTTAGYCTSV